MDQMTLFQASEEDAAGVPTVDPRAAAIYEQLRPAIESALAAYWIPADKIILAQRKGYTSVCLIDESSLIMRIIVQTNKRYIAVNSRVQSAIPSGVTYTRQSDGYLRISLDEHTEDQLHYIAESAADLAIMTYPSTFGCCSLYEQCSDARRCLRSADGDLYLGCYYRRNLRHGKVFYGDGDEDSDFEKNLDALFESGNTSCLMNN